MSLTYYLIAIASGIIAGWLMHGLMLAISHRKEVPVNMVRAIGSYGTGKRGKQAERIGLVIHTVGGALLGVIYGWLLQFIGISDQASAILGGGILGFFHGLVVCYGVMAWASQGHPVKEYRDATLEVGVVHLVGHIFFGHAVGLFIVLSTNWWL